MLTLPSPPRPALSAPRLARRSVVAVVLVAAMSIGLVSATPAGADDRETGSRRPARADRTSAVVDGEHVEISATSFTGDEWRSGDTGSVADQAGVRDVAPQADVNVPVGSLTQQLLDSHPQGTSFGIAPGVHRLDGPLRPRKGQELLGFPGAVLSGSKVLSGWTAEASRWYVSGQTQRLPRLAGADYEVALCRPESPLCNHGEDVFVDGMALEQVGSLAEVVDGTFYFDDEADRIYVGSDPNGKTVETTVTPQAIIGGATDVVVRNLVIEKFGNQAQQGAVHTGGNADWVIEHNDIRLNHGVGVQMYGGVLRANVIRSNGQLGVGGGGVGLLVEDNEIASNNAQGYNPYWEAGGTKWAFAKDLTVRNNWAHHNGGPGLWTDIDNVDVVYEGNVSEDNDMAGIMHEISYAATIEGNVTRRNGGRVDWAPEGAGILVSNSRDVQVNGNIVGRNAAGVAVRNDDRGKYETRNVAVKGNEITMTEGRTGLFDTTGTKGLGTKNAITFAGNRYTVPSSGGTWFEWDGGAAQTYQQWQRLGHDTAGTLAAVAMKAPQAATPVATPGAAPAPTPTTTTATWDTADGSAWSTDDWASTTASSGGVHDVADRQGRMMTGGAAPYAWALAEPAGGVRADGEMLVTMTRHDGAGEAYVDLWQRASDNGGGRPSDGYQVQAVWNGTRAQLYLYRVSGGAATWLGTLKAAPGVGDAVTVRFRTQGTTIAAKAWLASSAEPAAWDVEVSDDAIATGTRRLGVMSGANPAAVDVRFDDFRDGQP